MLKKISFTLAFTVIFSSLSFAEEIIKDKNGNYFLMKDNGTFIKLPKPKPGNKYVIKKKLINKKIDQICDLKTAVRCYEKILYSFIEHWNKRNKSNLKQIMIT